MWYHKNFEINFSRNFPFARSIIQTTRTFLYSKRLFCWPCKCELSNRLINFSFFIIQQPLYKSNTHGELNIVRVMESSSFGEFTDSFFFSKKFTLYHKHPIWRSVVFVELAYETQWFIVKNTLLHTCFPTILLVELAYDFINFFFFSLSRSRGRLVRRPAIIQTCHD